MQTPNLPTPGSLLELLEPRIAPASLADIEWQAAPVSSSILLNAGEGLSTASSGGSYMLYVEKGSAQIFTTDLNANNKVDFNEITGIAAGSGLRLVSFVDINGDIVTNLRADGRLTDSDGNAANGYDGRVVLNHKIESIVLRSVTAEELPSEPGETLENRLAKSSYSIFGNIYAGGGLGTSGQTGLRIDTTGFAAQEIRWGILTMSEEEGTFPVPSIGYIVTGSATSGQQFSFGTSPDFGSGRGQSLRGELVPFVPAAGQVGGDVIGVTSSGLGQVGEEVTNPETGEVEEIFSEAVLPSPYHLGGIITGDGGFGARGGNISNVSIIGDIGGLLLQTGNGGGGESGGNGGSITGLAISDSVNSQVVIRTGDGGDGLTGTAGQAGQVRFDGTVEMMGRITVGLGRGGDALGNAGAGTSLSNGTFQDVRPEDYLPAQIITTWRQSGDLGDAEPVFVVPGDPTSGIRGYVTRSIDFDNDGFSDAVMLTDVPDQLVVAMGSRDPASFGAFDPDRSLYLDSPSYAISSIRTSAVVVLEAGGAVDGRQFVNGLPNPYFGQPLPDLATGQSSGDGYLGVTVQLNKGFDPLTGQWLGFELPRYSPLPLYANLRDTTQAVVNLAAGDFDRDGVMDLGVITVGRTANTSPPFFGALTIMSGLKGADGAPDGYFAADFDKGTGNLIRKQPIFEFGRGNQETFTFVLHATAAEAGNANSDLLGVLSRGGRDIGASVVGGLGSGEALNTFSMQPTAGVVTETLTQAISRLSYSERVIDGNPAAWVGYRIDPNISPGSPRYGEPAFYRVIGADFVFTDADRDGVFDAVVVGQPTGDGAPGYLVAATLQGSYNPGAGLNYDLDQPRNLDPRFPAPIPNNNPFSVTNQYFGIALTERTDPRVASVLGDDLQNRQVLRMVSGNFDTAFDPADPASVWQATVALNGIDLFGNNNPQRSEIAVFAVTGFGQYPAAAGGLDEFTLFQPGPLGGYTVVAGNSDATRTSFYGYYRPEAEVVTVAAPFFTAGLENELAPIDTFWGLVVPGANPTPLWFPLAASTLELTAGNGGWSMLGRGGSGGSIGGGTLSQLADNTSLGSINSFGHVLQGLISGSGGFGLLGGGAAGSISGIAATAQTNFVPPDVQVVTASGGASFLGAGGRGGNVSQFDLRTNLVGTTVLFADNPPAVTILTGSGGFGLTGGSGGNVLGRNQAAFADTSSDSTVIVAGRGGYGASRGGDGGDVINLIPIFQDFGGVDVSTGRGGDSAAGTGGAGGDLAMRPSAVVNQLSSSLSLTAGDGGHGLAGGAGGSIRDFINEPTTQRNPTTLLALAGDGGDGVTRGGAGGSISGFNVTVEAVGGIGVVSAGAGGVGSGSVGGAGGSLRNVVVMSEAGATVGLAGAGGAGLRTGGVGGSLTGISFNAGGQEDARIVAMAGSGGNAYGVSLRTVEREGTARNPAFAAMFALGSSDGTGGNGGSIRGFEQVGATQTSTDLVAGNGGSTVNYGRITTDSKALVGRGGSISNVNLASDAGRIDPGVAIRSYAPDFAASIRSGETNVINDNTPGVGNVGVLVGAAGSVRNDLPSGSGQNGSVDRFTARNIMSMVAGSVERVAVITSVTGLRLQGGGTVLGALKDSYFDPNTSLLTAFDAANPRPFDEVYFAPPASPPLPVPPDFEPYVFAGNAGRGSSLVDGAVVTRTYSDSGPISDRVYVIIK